MSNVGGEVMRIGSDTKLEMGRSNTSNQRGEIYQDCSRRL
jgi:hypothetical protein